MKKTVAVIALVVISAMAGALAEEKWSANALKWRQLTPDERVFYIYGFTTGISYERVSIKLNDPPITFADSTDLRTLLPLWMLSMRSLRTRSFAGRMPSKSLTRR